MYQICFVEHRTDKSSCHSYGFLSNSCYNDMTTDPVQTYLGDPTKLKTCNQNAKTMISPQLENRDGQSLIIYANFSRSRIPTHLTPVKIPKVLHAPMSKYFSFPKQTFTFHSRDHALLLNKA